MSVGQCRLVGTSKTVLEVTQFLVATKPRVLGPLVRPCQFPRETESDLSRRGLHRTRGFYTFFLSLPNYITCELKVHSLSDISATQTTEHLLGSEASLPRTEQFWTIIHSRPQGMPDVRKDVR